MERMGAEGDAPGVHRTHPLTSGGSRPPEERSRHESSALERSPSAFQYELTVVDSSDDCGGSELIYLADPNGDIRLHQGRGRREKRKQCRREAGAYRRE